MPVYLDDLPSSRHEDTTVESKENSIPSSKKDAKQVDSNNDSTSKDGKSVKRQLSIADMFSKTPRDNAKRLKTENDSSSSVMRKAVSLGGIPTLNSIPLNLDAYRASLKPEELALLKLELETMGKSWFVQGPFHTLTKTRIIPSLTFAIYRLKVLTEEIKKPYFLNLKRFLASEGLENLGGTPSASKIYPPGK